MTCMTRCLPTEKSTGGFNMKLLQYFVAFLVFLAGFAIVDANVNGSFKHNVLAGSIGYLLMVSAPAIAFL